MAERGLHRLSTTEVLRLLRPHVLLCGLEVDHIVPRSIGGLDHPRNYCLVPAVLNRQWHNNWTAEKRAVLGHAIVRSACDFAQWAARQGPPARAGAPPPCAPCVRVRLPVSALPPPTPSE